MYHVTYLALEYVGIGISTRSHLIASSGGRTFKKFLLSEVLIVNILGEVLQILHVGPVRERGGGEGGKNK
jgi:hypothetical protein